MAQYRHGVYIQEQATSIATPAQANSALPVFVGVAPVHNLTDSSAAPVNEPKLIYSFSEFVSTFGAPGDDEKKEDFPLYQAAEVYLGRYGVAPAVFINVFDPSKHKGENGVADVSKVKDEDIVGGVDSSGNRTGLSLVDEVYPRFRLEPGLVLAPGRNEPAVSIAVAAAASGVSGFFKAMGLFGVPASVSDRSKVAAWLNDSNLTLENCCCFFGDCTYNGVTEPGTIHLAAAMASRDAANGDVPFWSPSNYQLLCEGLVHAGKALHLTPLEAAELNGNGIVTGLNIIGGLRVWGDQTAVYPGNTDIKDASIPVRRMFNWIGNTLILTCWQYVSTPLRRRLIETVQDTFNCWLNGLAGKEYILGGRVTFEADENPTTDLMDGKVTWHVYVTPPQAARELTFTLEYDPGYLSTLFGE